MRFIGIDAENLPPEFPLWPQDLDAASQRLSGIPRPWIGIHTSARDQTRRWPIQRFAQAAAQLRTRHGGTVILIGEERDREEMETAIQPTGASYRNLAGQTSLPVTGAIIKSLDVFLTNDTGPAHIAYATNTPTVTIFGGGDPLRNGPAVQGPFRILAYPVPCRPCDTGTCPIGLLCLENVPVAEVVSAAEELFPPIYRPDPFNHPGR